MWRMPAIPPRRGKSVSFNQRVTVRYLSDWSPNTYRAARKGPWLKFARDRLRFQERVNSFECRINK
jgi:Phosphatase-1 catalytic subunit binding region